jgi:3alpha(or 20beta)-hydroxysteroid dehydrogenase
LPQSEGGRVHRLANKVAIVTGAAQGIGAATAARLASEGASVVLIDVLLGEGEATAAALAKTGAQTAFIEADVSKEKDWVDVIARAEARFGGVDILVNNAAISISAHIEDVTAGTMRQVMDVNFFGTFHGIQAALPAMRRRGGGSIINVSSGQTQIILPFACAYGASKAALTHLSKTAAVHCARSGYNIRVNTIHPGPCDTRMIQDGIKGLPPAVVEAMHQSIPMQRIGRAEEVAAVAAFLASEDSSFVTAEEIYVDGGQRVV